MNYTAEELKSENWKDIDGYDGLYQVSDFGRVRSLKYGKTRMLRTGKTSRGYLQVYLSKDGKQKSISVHRLVADAFIENTDSSKSQVNHIDECKQNNRVSNLEYCTPQYNSIYNDIHHRRKRPQYYNCKRRKLTSLYDPNLSIKQNLEIFKEQGIECSERTVIKLRKDLGLIK